MVPVGSRRICDGSPTYSNWREMQIRLAQFQPFHLWIWNCWKNRVVKSYIASADDVDIKYTLSWTQLNFAGKLAVNAWGRLWFRDKCSHMPWWCRRPCRGLCPRHVGDIWKPGLKRYVIEKNIWNNDYPEGDLFAKTKRLTELTRSRTQNEFEPHFVFCPHLWVINL